MEAVNPDVSLQTLSAADGFLAGLVYLSATRQATTQCRITEPFVPQMFQSWKYLEDICNNLEKVRESILKLIPVLGLEGIDSTLGSFMDPVMFFQATVFSLRNTLIGQPPSTLGDVLALYSLSHVVSCHLRNSLNIAIGDPHFYIDQWKNAIGRYDHQQEFANLVEALYPELAKPSPASSSLQTVTADYSDPLHFIYQDAPFELPPVQGDGPMGYTLAYSDAAPGLLALPDPKPTNQAVQNGYSFSGEISPTAPQTSAPLGPHASALVTNLTLFLEQCGELVQILSGRWVTAKHQYTRSSTTLNQGRLQNNDVKSCMRQDFSFQEPLSLGILSIVDLFIKLRYLQTPQDVQEYMIIVGKVRRYHNFKVENQGS
ncbi:hypothetical protein FOPG_15471 [Fusarium oxysporum f. sp. conglutinans race 2 54008]|uniref:Uncharacterized protein n=1 Tax=Fusarium oxysporum f. sp. conglutinans race 2 54008 TaxID=1089457 RepID=X0GXV1_FUSOX|nr:hypothetical protein FOPG_15471 [Fusarium oxysporum f. sp. conglutinans race 2 54008]KAG7001763.1 hypothetical protein FocnCong_v011405 [Fusarium oxysporum f. sp. conglutinans]KAI8396423.1 hypothetical protein FOFC_20971 [Fusarium oxysporum]